MTDTTATTFPVITPYLYYEDGPAAMEWLERAFGFRERMRMANDDGTIQHAEMELGDAVIMLAGSPDLQSPARLGGTAGGLYVRVDDVDAHHRRAEAAGAKVEGEPRDQSYGDRSYGVFDLEGHQWWFFQPLAERGA